jgi:hypothetical protein
MLGNSRVAERLVDSQEGLSSMELVIYYYILFIIHDAVATRNNSGHDLDIIVLGDTNILAHIQLTLQRRIIFSKALVNYYKTEIKSSDSLLLSSAKQERQIPISEKR